MHSFLARIQSIWGFLSPFYLLWTGLLIPSFTQSECQSLGKLSCCYLNVNEDKMPEIFLFIGLANVLCLTLGSQLMISSSSLKQKNKKKTVVNCILLLRPLKFDKKAVNKCCGAIFSLVQMLFSFVLNSDSQSYTTIPQHKGKQNLNHWWVEPQYFVKYHN